MLVKVNHNKYESRIVVAMEMVTMREGDAESNKAPVSLDADD